jgi:hypothetical protein
MKTSSALGSTSASRLETASGDSPRRMRLIGVSSFSRQGPRNRRHGDDLVRDMARRELATQRGADPCAQILVEIDPESRQDEQQELTHPAARRLR